MALEAGGGADGDGVFCASMVLDGGVRVGMSTRVRANSTIPTLAMGRPGARASVGAKGSDVVQSAERVAFTLIGVRIVFDAFFGSIRV